MRLSAKATLRTQVRRAVRRVGYDVVPLAAGAPAVQAHLLRRCDLVVDVGANVGQFGERVRDLGFQRTIVSFEPGRDAFEVLAQKASRDALWDVRNCALGAGPSTGELFVSRNSVSSSLLRVEPLHVQAASSSVTELVETVGVETADAQLRSLSFDSAYLKLDVQGYESQVLEGASDTIDRSAVIQLELSFAELYKGQSEWLPLCQQLVQRGFQLFYIENGYELAGTGQMLQADFIFKRP